MKFDDLDKRMRIFETAHDHHVLPGLYMVARIDGRTFTRLTREIHQFEAPYDVKFRDHMLGTTQHLLQCGFRVIYGYTQSDEISLLLHLDDTSFGRKLRKLNSVLAGEASAKFSMLLGDVASFDCRISQLPSPEEVANYFSWRQEDATRNALNGHCYWLLRDEGQSATQATTFLQGMSVSAKNEFLFQHGINFNDLPGWQKRGMGVYWESYEKEGHNPLTGEVVTATRRRIKVDFELPIKDTYRTFIGSLVDEANQNG